jgi:hypothetical protein
MCSIYVWRVRATLALCANQDVRCGLLVPACSELQDVYEHLCVPLFRSAELKSGLKEVYHPVCVAMIPGITVLWCRGLCVYSFLVVGCLVEWSKC